MKWIVRSAVAKNNRAACKPNEDYCLADSENGIFIVADGVTMSPADYARYTDSSKQSSQSDQSNQTGSGDPAASDMRQSPAALAAQIAAVSIHEALRNEPDAQSGLRSGLRLAVERCTQMQTRCPTEYPACAVLVACCIRNDTIYCGYMGDSQAFILRGNARIMLTERQTARLNAYYAAHGNRPDNHYVYEHITNHVEHPLAYGVVMGDMRTMDMLSVSRVALEPGDRVIVSTDGLENYLLYTPLSVLREKTPEEMIAESAPYDVAPYSRYADDKSIIIIDIV